MTETTAADSGLAGCHMCGRLTPVSEHRCPLCGSTLHQRNPDSLQRTVALLCTSVLLYIPANVLPIMTTSQLGRTIESTILGGVVLLVEDGSYPIAGVIFIASVMVPIGKLLSLSWLTFSVARRQPTSREQRARLYRVTEFVGKWSMTDVFVVSILVALIHLGGLMRITPGPASVAFGGVVIFTMLAAESFDSRLIWDVYGEDDD